MRATLKILERVWVRKCGVRLLISAVHCCIYLRGAPALTQHTNTHPRLPVDFAATLQRLDPFILPSPHIWILLLSFLTLRTHLKIYDMIKTKIMGENIYFQNAQKKPVTIVSKKMCSFIIRQISEDRGNAEARTGCRLSLLINHRWTSKCE